MDQPIIILIQSPPSDDDGEENDDQPNWVTPLAILVIIAAIGAVIYFKMPEVVQFTRSIVIPDLIGNLFK